MSYEFTGTVKKVFPEEQKTDKFKVRDLVCESLDEKYPQLIKFQFTNDRCDLLDQLSIGETVAVQFDLRGREWNDKFFTNLNGWKVDVIQGAEPKEPIMTSGNYKAADPSGAKDDDIPF